MWRKNQRLVYLIYCVFDHILLPFPALCETKKYALVASVQSVNVASFSEVLCYVCVITADKTTAQKLITVQKKTVSRAGSCS